VRHRRRTAFPYAARFYDGRHKLVELFLICRIEPFVFFYDPSWPFQVTLQEWALWVNLC